MKEKALTYLLATGLMTIMLMVMAVFAIVLINGLPYFWPKALHEITLEDGTKYLGEIHARESLPDSNKQRIKMKIGNRDLSGLDFVWIDEANIKERKMPERALLLERLEWGNAYGFVDEPSLLVLQQKLAATQKERKKIIRFEEFDLGKINQNILETKQKLKARPTPEAETALKQYLAEYHTLEASLEAMYTEAKKETITFRTCLGREKDLFLFNVISAYEINSMDFLSKLRLFFSRIFEFVFSAPRESNTEGGVFPALFGTVLLVFLMSLFVFPFGVIAAIYLSEYAKPGPLLNLIRITIFNLAGVPSIVYGVFGLGFFIYTIGGTVDQFFFSNNLPSPTFGTGGILWASLTMAILTLPVVVVASLEGLNSVPQMYREGAYALSATKWEMIRDVVIPNAMPGMLTGLILAISRAAGEVAPLMITGVVKLALNLPVDLSAPFLHFQRKFMHLGFHIYDVGFQSPNVEAARPMVFNTTLLLLLVVFILNLAAIILRNRMRRHLTRSGV